MSPSHSTNAPTTSQTGASGSAENPRNTKQDDGPRRRTKTGCLTCRRRRIKCGEERPICKNCLKSKRECAGYVQPLVYKQQQQQASSHDGRIRLNSSQALEYTYQSSQTSGGDAFIPIQNYSFSDYTHTGHHSNVPASSFSWGWPPLPTTRVLAEQLQWPDTESDWLNSQQGKELPPLHVNTNVLSNANPSPFQFSSISYDPGRRPSEALTDVTFSSGPGSASRSAASTPYRQRPSVIDASSTQAALDSFNHDPGKIFSGIEESKVPGDQTNQTQRMSQFSIDGDPPAEYDSHGFLKRRLTTQSEQIPPSQTLNHRDVHVEIEDPNDPFDVDVEDAPDFTDAIPNGTTPWLPQHYDTSYSKPRNTLVHHHNFHANSPLLNDRCSHLFNHFMSYLVHCVSVFERAPKTIVSGFRKSTWGFYLPSAAVNRSALANAILAISALHLSILRGTSEDTAVKHFTYALRRLGKLLSMPTRRHEPATLATVLLLSFYEVISGDHSRWIVHLSGAGSFLMEHDFAAMARAVRRMRARARKNIEQPWVARHGSLSHNDYVRIADIPEALLHDEDWDVDSQLVSKFMGFDIDYDHQCQPGLYAQNLNELTEKEVEDWKVKLDLYWWYCKMDVYHSALSGDPLLMPYEQWRYCPPRGQLGKYSNICATTDHLLLILARIVDFGGKDLKRKQQVVASKGGQWIPAPGFLGSIPPLTTTATTSEAKANQPPDIVGDQHPLKREQSGQPPTANESRTRKAKSPTSTMPQQGPNAPPFYGMMPPTNRDPHMHSSYHVMEAQLRPEIRDKVPEPQSFMDQPSDIDMLTQKALSDHAGIARAFEIWAKSLGPDFEALPEIPENTSRTPFGPALRYNHPCIACTWALYYMGKILLRRLHPHSPPAAMMSAGVNAQFTRDYAQMIGRIVGGLYAEQQTSVQHGRFDPVSIAAMQETTFAFMFAAVQYQDAGQRGWTINKLRDLAVQTGWRSSTAVASACETTWYRMGLAGKGPPYERTLDARHAGVRRSQHGHQGLNSNSGDRSNPQNEYESQFVSHDRDLIDRHASTRAFWAIGVLSVEDDMQKLTLKP